MLESLQHQRSGARAGEGFHEGRWQGGNEVGVESAPGDEGAEAAQQRIERPAVAIEELEAEGAVRLRARVERPAAAPGLLAGDPHRVRSVLQHPVGGEAPARAGPAKCPIGQSPSPLTPEARALPWWHPANRPGHWIDDEEGCVQESALTQGQERTELSRLKLFFALSRTPHGMPGPVGAATGA